MEQEEVKSRDDDDSLNDYGLNINDPNHLSDQSNSQQLLQMQHQIQQQLNLEAENRHSEIELHGDHSRSLGFSDVRDSQLEEVDLQASDNIDKRQF